MLGSAGTDEKANLSHTEASDSYSGCCPERLSVSASAYAALSAVASASCSAMISSGIQALDVVSASAG